MGDRVGLHVDMPKKKLSVFKNGSLVGVAFSALDSTQPLYPVISLCHASQVSIQKCKPSKDAGGNLTFILAT